MSPKLGKKPARRGTSISGVTRMVKVARSPGFRLSFIGAGAPSRVAGGGSRRSQACKPTSFIAYWNGLNKPDSNATVI